MKVMADILLCSCAILAWSVLTERRDSPIFFLCRIHCWVSSLAPATRPASSSTDSTAEQYSDSAREAGAVAGATDVILSTVSCPVLM